MDDDTESISSTENDGDHELRQQEISELNCLKGEEYKTKIKEIEQGNFNRFQQEWDDIIDKYSKIDDIKESDEIDLITGEIVINNGHLQNFRNDDDFWVLEDQHGKLEQLKQNYNNYKTHLKEVHCQFCTVKTKDEHELNKHLKTHHLQFEKSLTN